MRDDDRAKVSNFKKHVWRKTICVVVALMVVMTCSWNRDLGVGIALLVIASYSCISIIQQTLVIAGVCLESLIDKYRSLKHPESSQKSSLYEIPTVVDGYDYGHSPTTVLKACAS